MKPSFLPEAVNTLHWIPTGIWYIHKKTGEKREKKRKIVHRRLFLTALPDALLIGTPSNLRIVLTSRGYSLSGRKETGRSWWEKDINGKPLPPIVAKDYTRLKGPNGKDLPLMNRDEVIRFLTANVAEPFNALSALESGEPLEGDERWDALEKFGYERPIYEEDEEVAIAA